MLFTEIFIIGWGVIVFLIVKAMGKSSKPDYVIEWEEKVKKNQEQLRISHTVEPDIKLSEKNWLLHIENHYTTGKK